MTNRNNIVAIVPVKGNSVRVKKKNLTKFANSNLFKIKLQQLKKTDCFKKIVTWSTTVMLRQPETEPPELLAHT